MVIDMKKLVLIRMLTVGFDYFNRYYCCILLVKEMDIEVEYNDTLHQVE